MEKIRHRIARCLDGSLHPDKLTTDELSYLDLFIFKAAMRVLKSTNRKDMLQTMPKNLQPLIRDRAKKILQ